MPKPYNGNRIPIINAAFATAGFDGIAVSFLNYGDELGYFAQEVLPRLDKLGIRDVPVRS